VRNDHAIGFESTFRPPSMVRMDSISVGDAFAIIVPLLQVAEFKMAGLLLASDLALIAALPIALIRHRERLRQKPIPLVLTLGLLWLLSQIATDLVRNSAPEDYLRTWIKICFVLVNFIVVWLVVCISQRRFVFYGIALGVGTIVSFYFHPSDDAVLSPWKFGVGIPITMLVAIFAALCVKYRYAGVLLPLTALAVVHVYQDFRILAVICFITAIYSLFLMSANRDRFGRAHLAILGLTLVVGLAAFTLIYSHFAELGVFGKYAQQKLEAQSGEGGLLLGGRGEILGSSQAILDSPLLGHGSWARDPRYSAILAERRAELGYKKFDGGRLDDLIPTHSYVFGAWVEAGIMGGIFWLFMLGLALYAFLNASGTEPLLPLLAFASLMLMWDILFSPLGTPTRFVAPYFMAAVVVMRSFQTVPPAFGWDI
jgi:O-antigen ligase